MLNPNIGKLIGEYSNRYRLVIDVAHTARDISKKQEEIMKYEEAIQQLESIVAQVENNELDIDQLTERLKEAQKLIRQWIQEFTEIRNLIVLPGQISIQIVSQAGNDENGQSNIISTGETPVEHAHEHRNQNDSQHGQFIR